MEGITVGMDEEFTLPSGVKTLYPTASGDPGEDINCRCYLEYGIEKEISDKAYEIANHLGYNPVESSKIVPVLRNDSEKWISNLSDDEKKSIKKYTYNGIDKDGLRLFEKINGVLEGRYTPIDSDEENMIIRNTLNIKRGVLKNTLKHDIIVYRSDSSPRELGGEVKKFLSTSATKKGVLGSQPNVAIIIPKGSTGAYIENLSVLKKQREFLLNVNTHLEELYKDNRFTIYRVK